MPTHSPSVSDAELRALPEDERHARLLALVRSARRPVNGELREVGARIAEFERVFGMTSAEMRERLSNGSLAETWPVCRWLSTLALWDRLASDAARAE